MFDTEAFIREVMKRPALYSSRSRESGENKMAYWEEIGQVIYKEWPSLCRPEQKMERIRELRKKWKSVRDNFLRDIKSPGSRKKRYVYHDLMTFLIPHLDPRRWHSGEEDGSDGDYRPVKRKQTSDSGNREFLMSLVSLLDEMPEDELLRVRQEMLWAVETASLASRERRVISAMAASPGLWGGCSVSDESGLWLRLAHNARMSVEECKKLWEDLVTDFKNHLDQDPPRDKWKYEDEMSFYLPYLTEDDKNDITNFSSEKSEDIYDEEEEVYEEDKKLPVELCQVECPPSPSDSSSSDTLTEFFINMAKTVATFPPRMQAQVKSDVFRAVNSAELTLHSCNPDYVPIKMGLDLSLDQCSRIWWQKHPDKIVEVDEIRFSKIERGDSPLPYKWIFCGICRETEEYSVVRRYNRKSVQLSSVCFNGSYMTIGGS